MKNNLIQFRAEDDFNTVFRQQIEALGVSETELARRSCRIGLKQAADEIAQEKLNEANQLTARLAQRKSITFTR